jgi:holo-[acyl-carrier protein] synthase
VSESVDTNDTNDTNMLTTGVDILHVHRVQDALDRHGERFLLRVFTTAEIAYCAGRAPELAARFAAKEAVSKALGVGMRTLSRDGIGWHEAEVINGNSGKPDVHLHGRAAQLGRELGLTQLSLSISHERDVVVAFVVAI